MRGTSDAHMDSIDALAAEWEEQVAFAGASEEDGGVATTSSTGSDPLNNPLRFHS